MHKLGYTPYAPKIGTEDPRSEGFLVGFDSTYSTRVEKIIKDGSMELRAGVIGENRISGYVHELDELMLDGIAKRILDDNTKAMLNNLRVRFTQRLGEDPMAHPVARDNFGDVANYSEFRESSIKSEAFIRK